ncbi:4-oxalocrotonate tautomerase DmpI [Moorella sp. Hama-1]|uniref:4-oxalocrotonate tautomerase DmpI n=1 Tax=Moorella sp. Hama-1 TaxID=2138101 RepID=UPI000D65D009|nr:4-oxalocrotonate tautomerase DmpI [Moorella sp. Hama-1]MDN5362454.1 4-oxalocrotonate tautomerase [Moorella sp. (in: firmicutes)]BCV22394.1 hypothetical protein hamaS1_24630 [Moorella sp. Hama-1]
MPVIQIDAGTMSREKKAELIKNLTDAASSTLNIPVQAFTVLIRENSMDNIGSGGKPLSELHK